MRKNSSGKILRVVLVTASIVAAVTIFIALSIQFKIHISNEWQQYAPLPSIAVPGKNKTIMVFAPHCDDETLGCGGLMAMATQNDAKVQVVLVTNGDGFRIAVGTDCKTIRVTPKKCIEFAYKRQTETLRALAILGIPARSVIFLGYPDRGIARLWDQNWDIDSLYVSHATKSSHSPYRNSFTYNAAYCGENLLSDIEQVIHQGKPTDIYIPHPSDNHSDHYATYCFVMAAIRQLEEEKDRIVKKLRVHTYLVHRGDWPLPKGYNPKEPLAPPHALASGDTLWRSVELTKELAERKRLAILKYKTQTRIERNFLLSFARQNELIGDISDRKITSISEDSIIVDGNPQDWWGIPPSIVDPVGDYVIAGMRKGGDVRAIYLCGDNEFLYIRIDCVKRLSKGITYSVNLRGISEVNSNDCYNIVIKPRYRALPAGTMWAYRNNIMEIAVPLAKLNFNQGLFIQVNTKAMRMTIDQTGWHELKFNKKQKSFRAVTSPEALIQFQVFRHFNAETISDARSFRE